jgi:hypothetical protein
MFRCPWCRVNSTDEVALIGGQYDDADGREAEVNPPVRPGYAPGYVKESTNT